jgi:hypothetical protein
MQSKNARCHQEILPLRAGGQPQRPTVDGIFFGDATHTQKVLHKILLEHFGTCMTKSMMHFFLHNFDEKKKSCHNVDLVELVDELCKVKSRDFKGMFGGKGIAGKTNNIMDETLVRVSSNLLKKGTALSSM